MATATANPQSPVPLDTIPISPEGGVNGGNSTENGEIVTVFHDKDNFNVKHPLAHKWTLWFTKPPSGKGDNWADLLKEVISFESVEEFWGVINNITPVGSVPVKADYHLFKEGVRPEWEDPQNKHGGKWAYTTRERKGVPIDDLWLRVMLAAIGETLEDENDGEIMGVVVNVRSKFYRIGAWTRSVGKAVSSSQDPIINAGQGRSADKGREVICNIGRRFKEALQIPGPEPVEFTGHSDAATSGSTRARAKYTV